MAQRLLVIGGAAVLAVVAILGLFLFREPEQASAPIEAIPIVVTQTSAPTAAATSAPAQPAAQPTAADAPTATPAEPAAAAAAAPAQAPQIFEIIPAESQARFLIDEVLRGSPLTVIGATDQVAGQIAINPADPQTTQIGIIQVNARTLATDNGMRNRAIKNAILRTNDFEFVTFTPTALSGLPASATVGESFSFQIVGDLTITNVTRSVTFDVTVTPVSETRLEGIASATVLYRDFNLFIPDAPSVDTVADEVRLELEFVAAAVS